MHKSSATGDSCVCTGQRKLEASIVNVVSFFFRLQGGSFQGKVGEVDDLIARQFSSAALGTSRHSCPSETP